MHKIIWLGSSFVINGLLSVLVISLLTRALIPQEYGLYSLTISAAGLINSIFFQWIKIYTLRNIPDKNNIHRILFQSNILKFISFTFKNIVFIYFILLALSFFLVLDFEIPILLVLFIGILQGVYELVLSNERAKDKIKNFSILSMSRAFIIAALCILSINYIDKYFYFVFLVGLAYLLPILYCCTKVSKKYFRIMYRKHTENKIKIKDNLGIAVYPTISVACVMGHYFLFRYSASELLVQKDFGTLVAKFDILFLLFLTPFMMGSFLYQTDLVKGYQNEKFSNYFIKSFLILQAVKFFLFLTFIVFSCFFKDVLIGSQFLDDRNDLLFIIGLSFFVLGIKLNWVDHSYYLLRNYREQAIVSVTTLLIFIVTVLAFEYEDKSLIIALSFFVSCICSLGLSLFINRKFMAKYMMLKWLLLSVFIFISAFYIGFLLIP
tara:strand:+ start:1917 stop:3224 length:1308 start_codon:yes stop_codon:yes gene_type:complete